MERRQNSPPHIHNPNRNIKTKKAIEKKLEQIRLQQRFSH